MESQKPTSMITDHNGDILRLSHRLNMQTQGNYEKRVNPPLDGYVRADKMEQGNCLQQYHTAEVWLRCVSILFHALLVTVSCDAIAMISFMRHRRRVTEGSKDWIGGFMFYLSRKLLYFVIRLSFTRSICNVPTCLSILPVST